MRRGSLTLFAVLIISVVLGFLLMLLEGARQNELRYVATLRSQQAIEGAFAKYNSCLWENFHLLSCNKDDLEDTLRICADGGFKEKRLGTNLLGLSCDTSTLTSYTLLTDGKGEAFIHMVASYMKRNILYESAKAIYNQFEAISDIMQNAGGDFGKIDTALNELKQIEKASKDEVSKKTSHTTAKSSENASANPLTEAKNILNKAVLSTVIEDEKTISQKACDWSSAVDKRTLQEGKNSKTQKVEWLERVLLQQYLLTYFSSYTDSLNADIERGALNYELEYLVSGKDNDMENLKIVVDEILLMRQALNLVYLMSDAGKVQEAYVLATALGAVTMNPSVIEAIKIGLLTAWALGESVLDVRALLQGKKIPLIKSKDTWTLGINGLSSISKGYLMAKESPYGVTYEAYVGTLLFLQADKKLAYRAMNIQEKVVQTVMQDAKFCLDTMCIDAKAQVVYTYKPVFSDIHLGNKKGSGYQIDTQCVYSYIE